MKTAMESIKEIVDVNTVVGDPVETPDGIVIIPISRVSAGFAAGGGEFEASGRGSRPDGNNYPFGGGSGAGVCVRPVGFLVSSSQEIRLLPVEGNVIVDRLIDSMPKIIDQVKSIFDRSSEKEKIIIKTQ